MDALGRWMVLAAALVGSAGCDSSAEEIEQLCMPGQAVFCRCANGAPGTQPCEADGMSFGACGPCDEASAVPEGPGSSTGSTEPGDSRPMLAACDDASQCSTTMCESGYCTSPCYKPSDCPYPKAECVPNDSSASCMPACASDADCAGFGGSCQAGHAIDGWVIKTCR